MAGELKNRRAQNIGMQLIEKAKQITTHKYIHAARLSVLWLTNRIIIHKVYNIKRLKQLTGIPTRILYLKACIYNTSQSLK
jgi:hypothetical protein